MDTTVIWPLAIVTLVIVIAVALWQRAKVAKAKTDHAHSALTEGRPAERRTDGAPGVDPQ